MVTALRIALHPSLAPFQAEVKYAWRTLMHLAGFATSFEWLAPSGPVADISYGPPGSGRAAVHVDSCGLSFTDAHAFEPRQLRAAGGLPLLAWDGVQPSLHRTAEGGLQFASDIVFTSFWLLTGARERRYRRDARDNFHLDGSFVLHNDLLRRPLVSLYSDFLRRHFAALGKSPVPLPWTRGGAQAAFAFSHDVDYPEMIRAIELLRVLAGRTHAARGVARTVLSGRNHFWKFAEWVDLARRYGTQPAFYFSARKGSLAQYAAGTPDCFYDIRSPRFRELFAQLRDAGCEIGLHASYHAHQDADQLRREKERLERAAGASVAGGRHHYWRLNPQAPHETLAHHAAMGMQYDSSLAFEFYPGFRRGTCYPFRPFHPGERRELDIVELPPTWMDDHFDRRLAMNRIADPAAPEAEVAAATEAYAASLLDAVRSTGGVAIVDYHVRGMNADFFPRYGPWLARFAEKHFDSTLRFAAPRDLAHQYRDHQQQLHAASRDCTESAPAPVVSAPAAALVPASAALPALAPAAPADAAYDACTVDFLRPEEEPAWDAFVDSHPDATIYHTLAWKRVTEEGLGHRPFYLRARDASGKLVGVLPLFLVTGLFGRRLVSMPMRDRGGVLAGCPSVAAALLHRGTELTRRLNCKYLELRSLAGVPVEAAGSLGFQRCSDWITTRINLQPGRDALWKALDRDAIRWAIGKAERRGLRFVSDNSESAVHLFYLLFARTRKAMGIPVFPRKFFVAMWQHIIRTGGGQLFLVYQNDEPVHAMICFASKDTFIPAYAAPQNRWRKLYPSEYMFWNSIVWAVEHGFRSYDFGADSFRQEGLLFFKRKWGGVHHRMAYDFFLHRASALPQFDSSAPVYAAVRKLWPVLPDPVSRAFGSWVTRQLS